MTAYDFTGIEEDTFVRDAYVVQARQIIANLNKLEELGRMELTTLWSLVSPDRVWCWNTTNEWTLQERIDEVRAAIGLEPFEWPDGFDLMDRSRWVSAEDIKRLARAVGEPWESWSMREAQNETFPPQYNMMIEAIYDEVDVREDEYRRNALSNEQGVEYEYYVSSTAPATWERTKQLIGTSATAPGSPYKPSFSIIPRVSPDWASEVPAETLRAFYVSALWGSIRGEGSRPTLGKNSRLYSNIGFNTGGYVEAIRTFGWLPTIDGINAYDDFTLKPGLLSVYTLDDEGRTTINQNTGLSHILYEDTNLRYYIDPDRPHDSLELNSPLRVDSHPPSIIGTLGLYHRASSYLDDEAFGPSLQLITHVRNQEAKVAERTAQMSLESRDMFHRWNEPEVTDVEPPALQAIHINGPTDDSDVYGSPVEAWRVTTRSSKVIRLGSPSSGTPTVSKSAPRTASGLTGFTIPDDGNDWHFFGVAPSRDWDHRPEADQVRVEVNGMRVRPDLDDAGISHRRKVAYARWDFDTPLAWRACAR